MSSEDLSEAFPWKDDQQRLSAIDDLTGSGYIIGLAYRGDHPNFHEYRELRLGPPGKAALARLS